ncbi:alpha-1,2-fucosyltransferase [Flavobacterium pectinovorum]|uniref:Glycosyl transferase family 11 n=1 Tax=Flavobacterium pectinovorum TaxID=29533 RepID=A0AB36P5U5_9FLAO|nr:alpha-1,2-fucosyltransferase [Flavobacterium pectinovorum]OXB07591.1 hypothetical protein B0A72_01630 [Flavobacterium pectinovorum]SHM73289.1 Glycosyl transferase family 11 [Flavobacterium pectinovorum]
MDVVVIFNGLGNQMSQYAFYLQKKKIDKSTRFLFDKRSHSIHNGYELESVFNIKYYDTLVNSILFLLFKTLWVKKYPFFTKPILKFLNLIGISLVEEKENYDFDQMLLKPSRGIRFLYGGWHSEKYFSSNRVEVLDVFKLEVEDEDNLEILYKIKNTNSISLHVRRGDYMKGINFEMYGSVCTKEYFDVAINKINNVLIEAPHFFIFSNDFKWVEENFKMDQYTLVACNKGNDSWKDIFLMSNCKHHINSNSTFSWWGAWLNQNSDKIVIAPKYFVNNLETKDFYPQSWLKISDY